MRWAALLLFVSLHATPRQPLTSETIFDWRSPASPQISPDGSKVVYVLETADRIADTFYTNLWIVGADGSDPRPISTGQHKDSLPRWSPDGTRLAYVSTKAGKPQIFIRWMDTGQEARITELETAPTTLSWAPDGQSLAFVN